MSKEKQIEEMAKAMCGNGMANGNCATDDEPCHLECVYGCCAERLYTAGYRKQSEGYWIENEDDFWVMCSECGTEFLDDQIGIVTTYKYCPNCGAKMRKEDEGK